jgi:hypothetical protein
MKKIILQAAAFAFCLILLVGCATAKPAQKQTEAAAVAPSVRKQPSAAHNSPMRLFVRGWLEGNAPPPDFKEEDKTGIAACLGAAYYASIVGLLIAGAAH